MTTIWKFKLNLIDHQILSLPAGYKLLSVGDQFGELCLWAAINNDQPWVAVEIMIYGTDNPTPPDLGVFIGTVIQPPFVWHVFTK